VVTGVASSTPTPAPLVCREDHPLRAFNPPAGDLLAIDQKGGDSTFAGSTAIIIEVQAHGGLTRCHRTRSGNLVILQAQKL